MDWDDQYWLDEEAEEFNVRERAQKMGVPREDIDRLLRQHQDAFSISEQNLENLKGGKTNEQSLSLNRRRWQTLRQL